MRNVKLKKEQRIVHILLMNSSIQQNIGLFQGKTGIMLFFMHYYRYTGNILYEDVASELLDEIANNLNDSLPINFESGLSGIGWTINYLITQGFIEGDSLDILADIDNKIMETDPRRITDYSLETGLGGILLYALAHIKVVHSQCQKFPFDEYYLKDLYIACMNIRGIKEIPLNTKGLLESYILFYKEKILPDECIWDISIAVQEISNFDENKIPIYPLWIKGGLSGTLFKNYCL